MPKTAVTTNNPILTEAEQIKRILGQEHHDRWGFAIYCCTYENDDAWQQFKQIVNARAQKEIQESNVLEILNAFEWEIFEDPETFNEATTCSLRGHFIERVRYNWRQEQPRAQFPSSPRHHFFIKVNREALDSVLNAPGNQDVRRWSKHAGWVDFIDAEWTAGTDDVDSDTESIDVAELDFEPIEGCCEENPFDMGYTISTYALAARWYSCAWAGNIRSPAAGTNLVVGSVAAGRGSCAIISVPKSEALLIGRPIHRRRRPARGTEAYSLTLVFG